MINCAINYHTNDSSNKISWLSIFYPGNQIDGFSFAYKCMLSIMTCLHAKKHWLFMSTWQPGQVAFISIPVMWTINGVMTVNGNEASAGVEIASYVIKCEHAHLEYITRPITPQPSPMLSNLVSYFTWALYSSTCLYDFYVHVITIPPNA